MKEDRSESIKILRQAIENSVGRKMRTPRDFEFLSNSIHARLKTMLSASTLKRIWEYIPGGETRTSTLSLLTSFLGYGSWEEFLKNITNADGSLCEPTSGYMLSRHISVMEHLKAGDRLRLAWAPDRICLVRYLGNTRFEVEESEKTRLKPGNTFSCALIMEGDPLYLDSLCQGDRQPASYVCGSRGGIRFERLNP